MELVDFHEDVSVYVLAKSALSAGLVSHQRLQHCANLKETTSYLCLRTFPASLAATHHVELCGTGAHVPSRHLEVVSAIWISLAFESGVVVGFDAADPISASLSH